MLIWPVAALGWITSMFQRGSVSLKRVNQIMSQRPEVSDRNNLVESGSIRGKVTFKNLSFAYPGNRKKVLRNIDITVEPGKMLAIAGRTGSGKTTLINLISRLYNVDEGTLFIDGMDINRISLSALRENIGYVPQDTFLFSSTIRENIDFFSGKEVMRQRTSIIVSHRISTIKDADEIIVLEEGEIAERDTHDTLLELQGILGGCIILQPFC